MSVIIYHRLYWPSSDLIWLCSICMFIPADITNHWFIHVRMSSLISVLKVSVVSLWCYDSDKPLGQLVRGGRTLRCFVQSLQQKSSCCFLMWYSSSSNLEKTLGSEQRRHSGNSRCLLKHTYTHKHREN